MNDKRIIKTIREIYIRMYKEAEPSASFEDLEKQSETMKEGWFEEYYLDMDRQCEIIDEYCKKNKLRKRDCRTVSECVHLGCSPNSSYENWKERWFGNEL
jgi:hypothetical protein